MDLFPVQFRAMYIALIVVLAVIAIILIKLLLIYFVFKPGSSDEAETDVSEGKGDERDPSA